MSLFVVFSCAGQDDVPWLRGEIRSKRDLMGNTLSVELVRALSHQIAERTHVGNDGSFEFRRVPQGHYEIRVLTAHGELLCRQDVDVRSAAMPLSITLPESDPQARPAGAVSVARLRHTPPRKAYKAFVTAYRYAEQGKLAAAVEELRKALRIDPEFPEAQSNLGSYLIRLKQPEAALPELRRAIELDPATGSHFSNLAYALIALRRHDEAVEPARQAVKLDGASSRSHCVLGYSLAVRPETLKEAVVHLRMAARELPHAHFVLAEIYRGAGDRVAARAELEEYVAAAPGLNPQDVERWKAGLR